MDLKSKPSKKEKKAGSSLGFGKINYILLAVGLGMIVVGYIFLAAGDITVAPVLLVIGYCAVLPAAILISKEHRIEKKKEDDYRDRLRSIAKSEKGEDKADIYIFIYDIFYKLISKVKKQFKSYQAIAILIEDLHFVFSASIPSIHKVIEKSVLMNTLKTHKTFKQKTGLVLVTTIFPGTTSIAREYFKKNYPPSYREYVNELFIWARDTYKDARVLANVVICVDDKHGNWTFNLLLTPLGIEFGEFCPKVVEPDDLL